MHHHDKREPGREPIPIDAGKGGDWIKQGTWDLHGIEDAETLRAYLGSIDVTVAEFKRLPVYGANVKRFPWLDEAS